MTKRNLNQRLILYGILTLFIWIPYENYAQTVIRQCISSYGYATTANVGVNQTAGQCYSTTSKPDDSNTILQGFQQPVTFSIEDDNSLLINQLDLAIYPNPAIYNVNIKSQNKIEQLYIEVTNLAGKLIQSEKIYDFQFHSINCESWPNGIYLISLRDNNLKSKTIKLIISK